MRSTPLEERQAMLYSKESGDFSMPMPFNYPEYINNVPTGTDKFFRNNDIRLYYHGYPYDIYQVTEKMALK